MIDRYLSELEPLLPRIGRRRILAEVEDHLREAAAEHGEEEAVARFGPPQHVARCFGREPRVGRLILLVAVATMLPAFYGVPENALPPAPWAEGQMPFALEWKRDAVLVLGALAALTVLSGRRTITAIGLGSAVAASVLAAVLAVQWADAAPGTPVWLPLVALVPGLLAAAGLYSATAPRAHAVK